MISLEDEKNILDLYYNGKKLKNIGNKYGITIKVLKEILKKYDIFIQRKPKKPIDMIGKIIGAWEVLSRDERKGGTARWFCLCRNCKTEYSIRGDSLRDGNSFQCRNCYRISMRTGYNLCSGTIISHIIDHANRRNIDFLISPQYLDELFKKQKGKCFLSGLDIHFSPLGKVYKSKFATASLDRINSLEDYIPENVRWVHKDINHMKWHIPDKEFLYFVNLVANFNKKNLENIEYNPELITSGIWKRCGNLSERYFNRLRKGANKRNILFSITMQEIWELFLKQKGKCVLTGLDIILHHSDKNPIQTGSIDRKNPLLPYTIENCQWVHKTANLIKWNLDEKYFINICKTIDNYQKTLKVEVAV